MSVTAKYKIGDMVWFIASASTPFRLYNNVSAVNNEGRICFYKDAVSFSYKFAPVPVCGKIKSIYVYRNLYKPITNTVTCVGGYRVSKNGEELLCDNLDDITYEIDVYFPPGVFNKATAKYYSQSPFNVSISNFVCGVARVKSHFVGDTPEKAEACFSEWQIDDRLFSSDTPKSNPESYKSFRKAWLFANMSNNLDNSYHNRLKELRNNYLFGTSVMSSKYVEYKYT